ncbi:AAA family ATPase [bacterium]|nr:AAA family ATPase [bacterium]
MATLTVVVGLPGSGKSRVLDAVREACSGVVADDYHAGALDGSPAVTMAPEYPALVRALRAGRDCAVADIAFTDTGRRLELERVFRADVAGVVIRWVFFANDLEACLANVRRRGRHSRAAEEEAARWFAPRYFVPEDVTVLPVWRASAPG